MDYLITERAHVTSVLHEMSSRVSTFPMTKMDQMIDEFRLSRVFDGTAADFFLQFGKHAWKALEMNGGDYEVMADLPDLLLDKHKRYGSTAITRWGTTGVAIRIDSKLQRVLHMTEDDIDGDAVHESIEDTLVDIIGYCVLGYYVAKGEMSK